MAAGNLTLDLAINQTMNESINKSAQGAAFMGKLSWQATIILGLVIMCFTAIIIIMIIHKKSASKHKRNPFLLAAVLTLGFAIVLMIAEGFELLPEGTMKNYGFYIFLALFFGIFFTFSLSGKIDGDKQSEKLENIGWNHIERKFSAGPNRGDSFGLPVFKHIVLPNLEFGSKDTDVFYGLYNTDIGIQVIIAIGMQTTAILKCDPDPLPEYVEKIFDKYTKRNLFEVSKMNEQQIDRIKHSEVVRNPNPQPA